MNILTEEQLDSALMDIRQSPKDHGSLSMIVRRPSTGEREILSSAELDATVGLVGDSWPVRGSWRSRDGRPDPDMQLTIMNSRVIALVAGERERWPLAGDQLFVDLDLSRENLPAGTILRVGAALIQVTHQPHTGCRKFAARFGGEARRFVNSPALAELRLRGINARVVQSGLIHVDDVIHKAGNAHLPLEN